MSGISDDRIVDCKAFVWIGWSTEPYRPMWTKYFVRGDRYEAFPLRTRSLRRRRARCGKKRSTAKHVSRHTLWELVGASPRRQICRRFTQALVEITIPEVCWVETVAGARRFGDGLANGGPSGAQLRVPRTQDSFPVSIGDKKTGCGPPTWFGCIVDAEEMARWRD